MSIDANEIENASMLNIRGELMSGDRVIAVILTRAWSADAGRAEKAGGPEKTERPGKRKAETQFQRKIGVTGLRAKPEPGSALDQEAWRDEKVRSRRYGLYP